MARRHTSVLPPPPADVPVELAAVPRVNRDKPTMWTRRQQISNRRSVTRSKELSLINEGLTSAAMVMDPKVNNTPAPNAVTRTWQHAAMGYRSQIGELNAATMYVGNALSRCSLTVGKRNPDGSVEQGYDGEEPVEGLDNAVAEEAAELISAIRSERGGQSDLLRSSGEKLFMVGELYYVPRDTSGGMMFDTLSTQELLRDGAQWTKYLGPGYGAVPLPEGVNPIRVWRPDGQWSMLATSSVRSCLEILEELSTLTRLVRSSAISRMALAGVLALPDELDTPDDGEGPDGQQSEAMNPLAVDMINTGAKAIDDPANASAWMPFIIQGPAEYLQHIRHIPFEAASQEQVIQRTEALQRLAQGLDMPVEVILGHMCVDEETQILTKRGWLSGDDLAEGDVTLTLNHQTGLSEWQPVSAVHRYDVIDERLRSIEARSHSSLTTANHRWPVVTAGHGKRVWRTSETLNTNCLLPTSAPNADLPAEPKWSDELVELVAWFYTEGTDHESGSITIYQSAVANPGHVATLRKTLRALAGESVDQLHTSSRATGRSVCSFQNCSWPVHSGALCNAHRSQQKAGIELRPVRRSSEHPGFDDRTSIAWRESQHGDMVRFNLNKRLADEIRVLAPGKVPTVEFLTSLTRSQLELFIDRSVDGDGCRVSNGEQFHQADPARSEAFELACIISGRSVTTGISHSTGGFKDSIRHQVLTRRSETTHIGRADTEWISYTGTVWCPTTANGTWFARRNGRSYFTGNSTTFTNAQQISIDSFRVHLEPTLQLICDALTVAYLWPAMAKNRGIDPSHLAAGEPYPDDILSVAVTYDAHHLVSMPDRSKDLLELYVHDTTQSSVKIAEIRDMLGLDPDEVVDPLEIAARVDAIRLTKIRETIVAPASDAAVSIAQIDKAVVPGQSAGSNLIGEIGTEGVTASAAPEILAWKVQAACDLTVSRAVERLGAKLRTKLKGPERDKWASVSNADLASRLGTEETNRILGVDADEAVRAEVSTLVTHVSEWAGRAGHPRPSEVAAEVGVLAVAVVQSHVNTGAPMTIPFDGVSEVLG
jgi:hypothetical protein